MKTRKRLTSLLLAALMLFSIVPFFAVTSSAAKLSTPKNIRWTGGTRLEWDPVPGAKGYELVLIENYGAGGIAEYYRPYITYNTYIEFGWGTMHYNTSKYAVRVFASAEEPSLYSNSPDDSDYGLSEVVTPKQLSEGYVTPVPKPEKISDYQYFELVKGQETTNVFSKINKEDSFFKDVKMTGGSLPSGMYWSWSEVNNPRIYGTPTETGYFKAYYNILLGNEREIDLTVYIMVTNNEVATSSETLTFNKGDEVKDVRIREPEEDRVKGYFKVESTGTLPEGLEWVWGEIEPPRFYGTPTQTGSYKVTFKITYYTGDVKLHTVIINIRDFEKPMDELVIDMSNGESVMTYLDYLAYIMFAFTYAGNHGQIKSEYKSPYTYIDLDNDGNYDVKCFNDGTYIIWSPADTANIKTDYTLTLSDETVAEFGTGTAYAKKYIFKFPVRSLAEIRIDLSNGTYSLPDDEYKYLFWTMLLAASRNLVTSKSLSDGSAALDIDKDGNYDVTMANIEGTVVFKKCRFTRLDKEFTIALPQDVIDSIGPEAPYAEKLVFDMSYKNPFKDVPANDWFTTAALWCNEFGYMKGTSETTFAPKVNVSRAMFVTILSVIEGVNVTPYDGTSFKDVAETQWYAHYIQWAYMEGFASGLGNGMFGPNADVTREQLAVFLWNYSKKKGIDVKTTINIDKYTDKGQVSDWAEEAVIWAVENGLISGTTETTLSPKSSATRAQIAVIVRNYVQHFQTLD